MAISSGLIDRQMAVYPYGWPSIGGLESAPPPGKTEHISRAACTGCRRRSLVCW